MNADGRGRNMVWSVIVVVAMVFATRFITRLVAGSLKSPVAPPRSEVESSFDDGDGDEDDEGEPRRPVVPADVDAFLATHRAVLDASRRPVVTITLDPMQYDELRVSKVGGTAYWPQGEPYPTARDGRPLVLLAQIDFAELPAPVAGLPSSGLLQFFIAEDQSYGSDFGEPPEGAGAPARPNFRVVYREETSAPAATLETPRASENWMLPHDPSKPRRMRFHVAEETLTFRDFRFIALFGGDDGTFHALASFADRNGIDLDELDEALSERIGGNGHKLGGYPYFTQSDPRTAGDRRELLFQLDSDDAMMWGDVGVANFFITPEDLARRDFRNVLYTWDCS